MDIIWHGHSCFTLKGKNATVVLDPFEGAELGKLPKFKANVVVVSDIKLLGKTELAQSEIEAKVLDWPGEAEVAGVSFESFEKDEPDGPILLSKIVIDDIHVVTLGSLSQELGEEWMNKIGDVDVLLVPVGGGNVLDPKVAQKVIESLEPRIVVPMNYDGSAAEFLKLMGKTTAEAKDKFSIGGRSELPADNMEVVLLNEIR